MLKVRRYFLELKKKDYTKKFFAPTNNLLIEKDKQKDFNINKFFYKEIGKDHYWRDRLIWSDKEWSKYISNKNLETWTMKINDELTGFYEKEFHPMQNEVELINMGILKAYRKSRLGSVMLEHFIFNSFKIDPNRLWVHTCSLDHKYALHNYKSQVFKIFKEEEIDYVA